MKAEEISVGLKVHYIPFNGCDESLYENGIVKEIPTHTADSVRVVYNCNGEWLRLNDYTSCLTSIRDLEVGWNANARNARFCFDTPEPNFD